MLLTTFEVIVGVPLDDAPNENIAVSEATRKLSAQNEDFREDAAIWSIDVYDGASDDMDWGIAITFDIPIREGESSDDLLDGLDSADCAETVTQLAGEP